MTAKNTSSTDQAQGALPFGAISDGGAATDGTAKKKVARKKATAKKATAKKAAPKTAAPKKVSKKKVAKKKVAKKASSRRTKADVEAEEPVTATAPKADDPKPAKKKTAKPKPSKAKVSPAESRAAESPAAESPAAESSAAESSTAESSAAESADTAVAVSPAESNGAAPARAKKSDAAPERGKSSDRGGEQEGGDGEGRRRRTRRGRRRRRAGAGADEAAGGDESRSDDSTRSDAASTQTAPAQEGEGTGRSRRRRRRRGKKNFDGGEDRGKKQGRGPAAEPAEPAADQADPAADQTVPVADQTGDGDGRSGRSRRRGKGKGEGAETTPKTGTGMFILDKGNVSVLRQKAHGYLPAKDDIYVSKNLVQKHKLRDGMMISGSLGRGYKHKFQLETIEEIDGKPPEFWKHKPFFKDLTSIDPDFHYAVGDVTDDVSMRVLDLIAPIGRGQRGLLVAPPRTGKTTIMRQFAAGIEKGYPDVHLMVLLIDERPEEATEWKRSVENGEVFVSTADETSKHHIQVAEIVWKRAMRLVEMGEDVVLLLDSITRLARAYNNQAGPGRTMSGGLDSRAMERPRKIFGSARNTVEAGSLTILGTTLIETGSKMDQMVFEEFKGTGNMELMLNRKLSDRRIFPSIDIARSGTRKEEKLVGMRRLKLIHVLRRVLARMHFAEAAELLITRLYDVEKTDDFLERFTVDPEA